MIRAFIRRRIDARKARFNAYVDNLYSEGVRNLTLNTVGFIGVGPAKDVVFKLWWARWRMSSVVVGAVSGLWWQSSLLYQTLPTPLPDQSGLPRVVPQSNEVVVEYLKRLTTITTDNLDGSGNVPKAIYPVMVALAWDALLILRGTNDATWAELAQNEDVKQLILKSRWFHSSSNNNNTPHSKTTNTPTTINGDLVKEFFGFLVVKASQQSHAFDIMVAARREWEPLVTLRTGKADPSEVYLPPYFMEACLGLLVDSYNVSQLRGHDTSKFKSSLRRALMSLAEDRRIVSTTSEGILKSDVSDEKREGEGAALVISDAVVDGVTGAPRAWTIRDPIENISLVVFAGTYKPQSESYFGVPRCTKQFARTWMANLRFSEAPLPVQAQVDAPGSGCHRGAAKVYNSLRSELMTKIPPGDTVITCGHSLGGALALLCAAEITGDGTRSCTVITAGAPAIFNVAAVKELQAREGLRHVRFQVTCDFAAWVFDKYKTGLAHSITPSRYLHFGESVHLCIVPSDNSAFNKLASYQRYLRTLADSKFGHGIVLYHANVEKCIVPTHYGGISVPLEFCNGGYRTDHPRLHNMLGF